MVLRQHGDTGVEPFPSIQILRASLSKLLRQLPQQLDEGGVEGQTSASESVTAITRFIERVSATGALLSEDQARDEARSVLSYLYSQLIRIDRSRIWAVPRLADFQPELLPELGDELCPYPGLRSFTEADAALFYGRTEIVDILCALVQTQRLVALIGPAGSGKSSTIWAGTVPALRRGGPDGSAGWKILPPVIPGADPLAALARVLLLSGQMGGGSEPREGAQPDPAVIAQLAADLLRLPATIVPALAAVTQGQPALLVVEQLEDLFVLCEDEALIVAFIQTLVAVVEAATPCHRVLLTLRTEAEAQCEQFPTFWQYLSDARVVLPLMSQEALRRAIEAPAKQIGLSIEADVVRAVTSDVLNQAAAPLLLQCCLRELWEARDRNRVTAERYEAVGSGQQILIARAERLRASLTLDEQVVVRRLLLSLLQANEIGLVPIRERVSALAEASSNPAMLKQVLAKMVAASVLRETPGVTSEEALVELTHEMLFTHWEAAAGWVREDRTLVAAISRLSLRARTWVRHGQNRVGLLDEGELQDAERHYAQATRVLLLTGTILSRFLKASRESLAEQRRAEALHRQRLEEAVRELREQRRVIESQGRAFAARSLIVDDPESALQLACEAASADDNAITAQSLRDTLDQVVWTPVLLVGHQGPVTCLAFYPGGELLATGSTDASVCLWSITGALIAQLKGHGGPVTHVAFRPDGLLASGGEDGAICLWRHDGAQVTSYHAHSRAVTDLTFSPDGRYLASAGVDSLVVVHDLEAGTRVVLKGHSQTVSSVQFSPDGKSVVTASEDWTARIWGLDGQEKESLDPTKQPSLLEGGGFDLGAVHSATFHPNGHHIITATSSRKARLWSTDGTLLCNLQLHTGAVWCAAFSPDGAYLATASEDGTAGLWTGQGKQLEVLRGHHAGVRIVTFSANSRLLLTGADDGTARLWDTRGILVATLSGHNAELTAAQFGPNDAYIATASRDGSARLWQRVGPTLPILQGHSGAVYDASYSPDGRWVITASGDGTALIWEASGTAASKPLSGNKGRTYRANYRSPGDAEEVERQYIGPVRQALFRPNGEWVLLVSEDTNIRLWHRSGDLAMRFRFSDELSTAAERPAVGHRQRQQRAMHSGIVQGAAFSPDGSLIVTASADRTARLWRIADHLISAIYVGGVRHEDVVQTAAFSPDSSLVVTASADRTAKVLTSTGELVMTLVGHIGALTAAVFHQGSTTVVTTSADHTARIWDLNRGISTQLLHGRPVRVAICSPTGGEIITLAGESIAYIWDVNGERLTQLLGHRGEIVSASFSPDGRLIATASTDRTARLWTLQGELVGILRGHTGTVWSARFSPDGRRVITASDDGLARQYLVATADLVALAQHRIGRPNTP